MSLKPLVSATALTLALTAPAWADIEIHDAYARSSIAMAGAAFMVIHNHGDTDDRLIGVTSDVAARTELHTHIEDETGVMRMTHVEEGFALPAGGEILMTRGAGHVMFMGLTAPFEQDDMLTITFEFENAGEVTVEVPVDQAREDAQHMDHGNLEYGDTDHGADH